MGSDAKSSAYLLLWIAPHPAMTSIREFVSELRARLCTREPWLRFPGLFVLLLSLALCVSPDWSVDDARVVAATVSSSWCLLAWSKRELRALISWSGLCAVGGFAVLSASESDLARTLGACAWIAGLAAAWTSGGLAGRSMALAAGLVAVGWVGHLSTPWLFGIIRDAALTWSRAIGSCVGRSIEIGPTLQGWTLLGLGVALLVSRFVILEWRPRHAAFGLSLLAASSGVAVIVVDAVARSAAPHLLSLLAWLALIPLAITVALCALASERAPRSAPRFGARGWLAVACGLIAFSAATHARVVTPSAAPRVLFYSVNEGRIFDWRKPVYGSYGPYSLGYFGLLPERLSADGFDVSYLREPITSERLATTDVLVTFNVNTKWTEDELLAVWEFVHGGGRLLVLGDHTDVDGTMQSQNDLLAPVGIEFRFDAAVPMAVTGWQRSDLYLHPTHARVEHVGSMGIAVGGSLKVANFGASPLVVGRHGLADRGDEHAEDRAFLGDYHYQSGEQLGDLVLAAWRRLGAGAVVVYGDTSGLQNSAIDFSYERWAHDLFTWLTGKVLFDLGPVVEFSAGLVFFLCGFAVVAVLRGRPAPVAAVSLGLLALVEASRAVDRHWCSRPCDAAPQVLIDSSHLPRIENGGDSALSLSGFSNCATRSGYRVGAMPEFSSDRLSQASMLITVAPAQGYSDSEVEELTRFMDSGGFILACASYPQSGGLEALLSRVGLAVLPRPVGPIPLNRDPGRAHVQVEYVDAWEVGVRPDFEGEAPWVYGEFQRRPLAMLARRGRGGLFLVGDSAFFGAGNLESFSDFSEPNILFLRGLLADIEDLRGEQAR